MCKRSVPWPTFDAANYKRSSGYFFRLDHQGEAQTIKPTEIGQINWLIFASTRQHQHLPKINMLVVKHQRLLKRTNSPSFLSFSFHTCNYKFGKTNLFETLQKWLMMNVKLLSYLAFKPLLSRKLVSFRREGGEEMDWLGLIDGRLWSFSLPSYHNISRSFVAGR